MGHRVPEAVHRNKEKTIQTAGKQAANIIHYFGAIWSTAAPRFLKVSTFKKKNSHLHYITEGKLYSFGNMPRNDRCLGTNTSHRVFRFPNHLSISVLILTKILSIEERGSSGRNSVIA